MIHATTASNTSGQPQLVVHAVLATRHDIRFTWRYLYWIRYVGMQPSKMTGPDLPTDLGRRQIGGAKVYCRRGMPHGVNVHRLFHRRRPGTSLQQAPYQRSTSLTFQPLPRIAFKPANQQVTRVPTSPRVAVFDMSSTWADKQKVAAQRERQVHGPTHVISAPCSTASDAGRSAEVQKCSNAASATAPGQAINAAGALTM